MKHIKGYKIFESESSDFNDVINDTLSSVADYGYSVKIYDYYHTPNDEGGGQYLFNNKASVGHLTHKTKLIKLSNKKSNSQFFNIDDFSSLGFSSSGFTFITDDFQQVKDFYFELLDSISQFSEYNPKLWMSSGSVMIILDLGPASDDDIKSSNSLKDAYDELNGLLEKFNQSVSKSSVGKLVIMYYGDSSTLKLRTKNEDKMSSILASLCSQMADANPAYGWMNDQESTPRIGELVNIKNQINKMGYNITFKSDYDDYKLTLVSI